MAKITFYVHSERRREVGILVNAEVFFVVDKDKRTTGAAEIGTLPLPQSFWLSPARRADCDRREVMAALRRAGWQWLRTYDTKRLSIKATRKVHGIPEGLGKAIDKIAHDMTEAIMAGMRIGFKPKAQVSEEWPDTIDG